MLSLYPGLPCHHLDTWPFPAAIPKPALLLFLGAVEWGWQGPCPAGHGSQLPSPWAAADPHLHPDTWPGKSDPIFPAQIPEFLLEHPVKVLKARCPLYNWLMELYQSPPRPMPCLLHMELPSAGKIYPCVKIKGTSCLIICVSR